MYKEVIISLVVILFIVIGNVITQNNTVKITQSMETQLNFLREEVLDEKVNQEKTKEQMAKIQNLWQEKYETMAYYIEHEELEKVETQLTRLKANIEVEEYSMAVETLDTCAFILEHIKDKSALKIVNLF